MMMAWGTHRPTRDGYYWVRMRDGRTTIAWLNDAPTWLAQHDAEAWAGPIPEPWPAALPPPDDKHPSIAEQREAVYEFRGKVDRVSVPDDLLAVLGDALAELGEPEFMVLREFATPDDDDPGGWFYVTGAEPVDDAWITVKPGAGNVESRLVRSRRLARALCDLLNGVHMLTEESR